jgi:hypothetical protein
MEIINKNDISVNKIYSLFILNKKNKIPIKIVVIAYPETRYLFTFSITIPYFNI